MGEVQSEERQPLISGNMRECKCPLCEEGRFIKRLVDLLPEAEANELNDWYHALLDNQTDRCMDFYWLELQLKAALKSVQEFAAKRIEQSFECDRCGRFMDRPRQKEVDICHQCREAVRQEAEDRKS